MKYSRNIRYLRLFLPILVVGIVLVSVFINTTGNGKAAVSVADQIRRKSSHLISPFGIETNRFLIDGSLLFSRADDLGTNWVRMNDRISWRELQPIEGGDIDWAKLANFENELKAMKERRMTPVVIIDDHPHWAVKPYDVGGEDVFSSCAAIKTEKFPAFVSFVQQLVERYSDPQYNVHHWELGNEVDIDPRLVPVDNIFGCWGDKDDPFYGGRHYGEMLKVVTPAIKAADHKAQVWVGGLLLDNPNTQPENGLMGNFLAGILEVGAGPYFDILPYHAYFGYYGQKVDWDNGNIYTDWYPWGG